MGRCIERETKDSKHLPEILENSDLPELVYC
jgi:hypothetical protein